MDKRIFECKICKVNTTDQKSLDNHLLGSKHQLALHTKLVKEKKERCGVYVTGLVKTARKEEINNFFAKFGKIVECYCGPENRFAIIQFGKEETAQELMKKRVSFQGRPLLIRPRVLKTNNTVNYPPVKQDLDHANILELISQQPDFNTQLTKLVEMLHEIHLQVPTYNRVCNELERCLRYKFPNCRVWPFGSTVSGLGFKNSDIDIYVEVVTPLDISSSSGSPASVYTKIARNALAKTGLFSNVIAIPKAKIPIVTFMHRATRIECDLNFKNILGVCNSNLIKFLLSLDQRLRPFMFAIKYWGKVHDISSSGKISSYGIIMLAIFYLQQKPNPILPPIEVFQTPESFNLIEGWNGGFSSNPAVVPNTCTFNHLHISELLQGFFNFWAKFDYGFNVICPLTGEVQLRSDFSKPEDLPQSFIQYKANFKQSEPLKTDTSMCLQDPFELSHNVTANIASKHLEDFQKLCEISADICNECLAANNNKIILPKLFSKLQLDRVIAATDTACTFKISGTTLHVTDINKTITDDPKHIRTVWFEKVNQFLVSVLSKLFLFQVSVNKDVQPNKSQKLDGQSDIHDTTIVDTLTFHCVGYNNVWEARKSISKNLNQVQDNGTSFLEQEISISEYIVNVLCKGIKVSEPIVDFNLTLNCKINPTEAEFILNNVNSRKSCFRLMANFFARKLPGWLNLYLKEFKKCSDDKLVSDPKENILNEIV